VADNKISVQLDVEGNAAKKLDEISSGVENLQDTFQDGFAKASSSFNVFKGVLEAAAVEKIFEVAVESASKLFELFVSDGVKAAIEQEEAVNRLNTALALSGEYSSEASENFLEFADQLQEVTKFDGDAIVATGALIESLGNLSEEGLEQATLAAANLASQLGVDLQTAAQKLGVAAEGNVASLKKFGVEVEEGETKAETFANAIEAINSKFGGAAQAATKTYAGSLAQIRNSFDDLVKTTGQSIVSNNVIVGVFGEVNKILKELVQAADNNKEGLREYVGQGVIYAIDATVAFAATLDSLYRVGVIAFNGIRAAADLFGIGLVTVFGGPIAIIDEFLSKIPGIGESFGSVSKLVQDTATTINQDLQTAIENAGKSVDQPTAAFQALEERALRLRDAAVAGFQAMQQGISTTIEPTNQAKLKVEELTESMILLGEEGQKIAEQAANRDPAAEFVAKSEALAAAKEQDLITEEEYQTALTAIAEDAVQKQDDAIAKKIDKIRAANDALIADSARANQTEIDSNNRKIQAILASEGASTQQRLAIQKKLSDDSVRIDGERVSAGKSALDSLASFQNAKTKEVAAVGKAAAIASTVISTYEGASKAGAALAGIPIVGPILAGAAIGAYIASGLARVAIISGVQLASGIDEVPGIGTRDNFPAILAPGERVVPAETNQDLKAFLADQQGQQSALNSIADKLDRLQNQVIVNIGSKEIINEINDATRSGRVLA
jgi:hypothetical protein